MAYYITNRQQRICSNSKLRYQYLPSYLERLRKNQSFCNSNEYPDKKDVADARTIYSDRRKIDILEEQIWKLQDSVSSIAKDNVGMFEEILNFVYVMRMNSKMAQRRRNAKMNADLHDQAKK
jgi:hypothetical protein